MVLINIVSHGKKDFICDNCGRTYKYQRALHRHSKYECGFNCSRCQRIYKYKRNLTYHLKNECGVQRQFECQHCNKRFKQRSHLKVHQITHLTNIDDLRFPKS
ncbi:uncharacterized protein isoform X1 [Rhodnius prolixus]|uniref:uncharacterized protein isoform X1 n=1 Tax=Rhodnius prolixus TaxID=13249 RepID=UPI003D18C7BA